MCDNLPEFSVLLKVWTWAVKTRSFVQQERRNFENKYDGQPEQLDVLCEIHIQKMVQSLVEKAELLLRLETPVHKIDN